MRHPSEQASLRHSLIHRGGRGSQALSSKSRKVPPASIGWNFDCKCGLTRAHKPLDMSQLGICGRWSESTIEASRYQPLIADFLRGSTTFSVMHPYVPNPFPYVAAGGFAGGLEPAMPSAQSRTAAPGLMKESAPIGSSCETARRGRYRSNRAWRR